MTALDFVKAALAAVFIVTYCYVLLVVAIVSEQ